MAMRSGTAAGRRGRVVVVIQPAFIGVVTSLATIIGTTFFRADHVATQAQVTHLHYGFPLAWATQDQSQFPPLPHPPASLTFASPWHNPTRTSEGRLLADFVIIGVVPAALYCAGAGGAAQVRRRRNSRAPKRHLTHA